MWCQKIILIKLIIQINGIDSMHTEFSDENYS